MGNIEERFNFSLANVLGETNPTWGIRVEQTGQVSGRKNRTKSPDLIIRDGSQPPVIIETSYQSRDAEKDALSRLGIHLTECPDEIHTYLALHVLCIVGRAHSLIPSKTFCYQVLNCDMLSIATRKMGGGR